jgi:hypothetical protein
LSRNPVAAHNSAVLTGLLAAFLAMWALVFRLTQTFWAAAAAATGYAFSAFTASHTAEIQLLMFFGFPLVMLAFQRVYERSSLWSGVWLGAALALTGLSCGYYGVYAGGMAAVAALAFARRSRAYWMALGAGVLVTALLVGPVLLIYTRARAAEGVARTTPMAQLDFYSANASTYLTSGSIVQAHVLAAMKGALSRVWPRVIEPANEVLFPGIVVTIFAAVGVLAGLSSPTLRRSTLAYLAIAVHAGWTSLGPRAGLYTWQEYLLPGMSLLRAPSRMGIVVTFALAVLAGIGLAPLVRRRAWIGPACVAALAVELWVPWSLQQLPLESSAYDLLATLPRGGVVEFPFPYDRKEFHQHTKAMIRSMRNWQPLLNGYSDSIPADFYELALPVNAFPDPASFAILRSHAVRYVIVRVGDYGEGEYSQALRRRFPPYEKYLRRLADDRSVWLFEILSWPE